MELSMSDLRELLCPRQTSAANLYVLGGRAAEATLSALAACEKEAPMPADPLPPACERTNELIEALREMLATPAMNADDMDPIEMEACEKARAILARP